MYLAIAIRPKQPTFFLLWGLMECLLSFHSL
jgi:hypothetical protein